MEKRKVEWFLKEEETGCSMMLEEVLAGKAVVRLQRNTRAKGKKAALVRR